MTDYIKEAKRAKREGDYSKAGDLFYLAGDEKSALDMYLKGSHYSLAARLLEKKEDWRGATKYYIQSGKYLEAAEIYQRKLKDYRSASAMFEKLGDMSRASEMAERAGDISRAALLADQCDLWERAANLYFQTGKYERAADMYYRILQRLISENREKDFLESHQTRLAKYANAAGTLYQRLKNYDKAAQCFEEGNNFSKAAECYSLAGMPEKAAEYHYRMQNYDEAYELLSALRENCEQKELFADTCFHLKKFQEAGDLYIMAGRNLRAAEAYESGNNLYRAALLYEGLEDYARAADLFFKLKETRKAAELYEKAKNFEFAAKLYEDAGLLDKAVDCLVFAGQRALAAKVLITKNETERAVSLLQEIPRDQEEYPEACLLLGRVFSEMSMYSVATQKFVEAIQNHSLSKENIDMYYGLAVTYEKAAQYSKAREIYEKILSIQLGYRDVMTRLEKITGLLDGTTGEPTPSSLKRMLASRYELNEKIGQDHLGILYKALDTSLGRTVTIRRLMKQDENITRNIVEQMKAVSSLTHSNILAIYDSGKDEEHYFLCTEYTDGQTLRQYLSRGLPEISEICQLATQISLALSYAHKQGVVHKNLCPENIYVSAGPQAKITNFGIEAKWDTGNTNAAKQYSSPEQIMGQKVDGRTDLYAFGVILYEMVYGNAPFAGNDVELQHVKKVVSFPETPDRAVPIFLIQIIQKCLQKDRQHRYKNAQEIVDELEIADIVPGMVINERYEIIKELGAGGMGHVYKAKDRDLDEVVALKVLRAEISSDPVIRRRFVRELKTARMITHPNVVKVFDIGTYKGNRYISMEFIEGTSLDEWIRSNPNIDSRTLLTVLVKIIQGVQAAHARGIIHRDLKPQNVLLDPSLNPRVLDFGIARSKEQADATASGQILGSPKYMAPEQIQGKDLDKRCDIYAMGVIMFLMFTKQEPFTGDDPRAIILKHLTQPPPSLRKINPSIPVWLERIVMKALEKDRNQRYASLKDLLEDLKKGYETQKA